MDDMEGEFGKEAPLSITRGKVHEYLGMNLDFGTKGKVKISMVNFIDEMLDDLPVDMKGTSATPASNNLFVVNEKGKKLEEKMSDFFHHNVAKLLYMCKRARPDIQTAVAFLCTRVKSPDEDDYKKLSRVMRYLRGTRELPLTLESDGTGILQWWVDALYAVHPDMRSHTGGAFSLGKGAIYGTSTKQKLVTKSSTEAELVGAADVLPQLLWTKYFLKEQEYPITDTVMYQDNRSAMLLENNGRMSSGKRTRHINIRYFFINDRINAKELRVEHCPTGEMLSDFFTKPLQGSIFRKFRDRILNVDPEHKPTCNHVLDHRSVLGNVPKPEKAVKWVDLESGGKQQLPKYKEADDGSNVPGASSLGNEWTTVTRKSKTVLVKRKGLSKT